ncbi:hypothetical protein ABS735_28300 [Streptomyces sp. MMCC 100]|uniref:hypothetical protein n=1 Tax=Streptomyces sp. MMCC 100 TaxID=3163555 RepID=UPI0035991241
MAKSGPQKYPGASTAYWYQSRYGGDSMESNVIVWHTTEGTSLPSYGGGASAPNFTAKPDFAKKKLVWYQHFDFDTSARALVNKAGGVETNTLNVCQVEIVGTCDPSTHKKWGSTPHLYTPDLPDWAIRDLGEFAKWAHDHHGVPLTSGVTFKAYPSSYGASSVRMSASKWNSFRGHCGHQHVPENDHGDPGAFPMAAILAHAKGDTTTTQEDDMPTAADVWKADVIPASAPPYANSDYDKNKVWTAQYALGSAVLTGRKTEAKVDALTKQVAAQTAAISKLAQLVGSGVDTEQVVAAVEKAIADAVVQVDVDITGQEN